MIHQKLFDDGNRQWHFFGRDPLKDAKIIDSNQYAITHQGHVLLMDPGGLEIFPSVSSEMSMVFPLGNIQAILATHQDPDIASSLPLWEGLSPEVKVYHPWVWGGFLAHYSPTVTLVPVPDPGGTLPLGGSNDLRLIPAHYVHSSGNLSLYDPTAKILFSGDIGGAILPPEVSGVFVENFQQHTPYMTAFHQRWMPSNEAKNRWVARVRKLEVNLLCPQHGKVFKGGDVARFLDWLEALEVGLVQED